MRRLALLLVPVMLAAGQDLDTVGDKKTRRIANVMDQVENPRERELFLKIYRETTPLVRRSLATEFLRQYSASWLLPQVLEAASKAAMEMDDLPTAIYYGKQSLRMYPENPLLLVPMATMHAKRGEKKAAGENARAALDHLARFAAPAGMPESQWRPVRDSLVETASRIAGTQGPATAPHRPDAAKDYAGSAACQRCHTAEYAAWRETGMARMLRPLSPDNVLGDFSRGSEYRETGGPVLARAARERDAFFIDLRRTAGKWDRYRLDYTIGSKWQQAYATRAANGELHVLPIQYNLLEKKWLNYWKTIDPAGSERAATGSFHEIRRETSYQQNCAPCHTSQLREQGFGEPGVNCEMCHGPAAAHVAGGPSAFRFSAVSNRAYVEVCAQCHAQSALREPQAFPPRYERRPYVEFSRKAFYRDGRFRETTFIVESFERSACFRKGQAHCGSCHDPHPADAASNPTSLKFKNEPDRMCLQCHGETYTGVKHTKHRQTVDGSRCVSCHMPKIMNSLLFRARSHQIDDKPDAATTERFGQRESPNACLVCHAERTVQWTREQLRSW
jgi:predicted CXXCH cytochrome family protein